MIKQTTLHLIENKVNQYNKAKENSRFGQASVYLNELQGMQQILESMGIWLELDYDSKFLLHCKVSFM